MNNISYNNMMMCSLGMMMPMAYFYAIYAPSVYG